MATLDRELQDNKLEELGNHVYNCKDCNPYIRGGDYCEDCKNKVIKFMSEFGLGVLMQDETLDDLSKRITSLQKENKSLSMQLEKKTKRVEELKCAVLPQDGGQDDKL